MLGPVERFIYRLGGVRRDEEMNWRTYAVAVLIFNLLGVLVVYTLQRLQHRLPLNPQGLTAVSPDLSFNTAVSFASNTNWQSYSGESTLSYLTQMLGLTVQNFVSAATGMAVLVALDPGAGAEVGSDHRELLGRSDPQHALHPAAAFLRAGPRARFARRRPDLLGVQDGGAGPTDGERRGQGRDGTDARPWPRRLADRN